MSDDKECYCGPYWLWKPIRCWLSKRLNRVCKKHDEGYKKKEISKSENDYVFLDDGVRNAKGRFFREVEACFFFLLVRIGGKLSWKKDKK